MELQNRDAFLAERLKQQNVLPIVGGMTDHKKAVDLAEALFEAGVKVMEFPVRGQDPAAVLLSISKVREKVPNIMMGAGSVVTPDEWGRAIDYGAQFGVSPGMSPKLMKEVLRRGQPFIAGFETVSEGMALQEEGFELLKWFPAEQRGGAMALRTILPPFLRGNTQIIPTGGIALRQVGDYLALKGVVACGGSWVTPEAELKAENWEEIKRLAEQAICIRRGE